MMNCRSSTASSSIKTLRPALPSIFVMVSIAMFLLGMLADTEQFQKLVQRLNKGRYLHRAPTHHVVDTYHLAQALDLPSVVEVTQIPPDPLVQLLADELVPARRRLTRTGALPLRHPSGRSSPRTRFSTLRGPVIWEEIYHRPVSIDQRHGIC